MWPRSHQLDLLQAVPLGPQTYRLHLQGGRSLIAKRGTCWEGLILRTLQRLDLAPRLIAARQNGAASALLLMTDAPGAPPDWTDEAALTGVMRSIATLHVRTSRPDGTVLCHGDLHQGNLLWDGRQATLLDWALARRDDPLTDLVRIWPWAACESALSPGCDLPTGEIALTALALYHKSGPLAHLSWRAFRTEHRAAVATLLQAERDRHQDAARVAPAGLQPWIETQAQRTEAALREIERAFPSIPC